MQATNNGQVARTQGRLVWGSGELFKGKPKFDQNTRQPVMDNRTGQQVIEYGFGLAVPKNQCEEIWKAMHAEAMKALPAGAQQIPPNFAMKYKDGDGIDDKGVPFSQRPGYAGCLVFAMTTRLPIKWFKWDAAANNYMLINEGVKVGDYVDVQVMIKGHGSNGQSKPGLYLNPLAVLFLGYGEAIVNAPSGEAIFGAQAPTLPPGASATPLAMPGAFPAPAPTMAPMPTQSTGYAAQGAQAQFAPPFPQQQAAPAPAPVQPHYGVVPPQFQPQAQAPQGVPAMPGLPQMPGFPQQ